MIDMNIENCNNCADTICSNQGFANRYKCIKYKKPNMIEKYKLLKDVPGCKTDTIFTWNPIKNIYESLDRNTYYTEDYIERFKDDWFEKVELKLEVGKWYKYIDIENSYLLYEGDKDRCKGFWRGTWGDIFNINEYGVRLANIEEVKKLLLEETKKKYPEGTHVISTLDTKGILNGINYDIKTLCNTLVIFADGIEDDGYYTNFCLYDDGKWAEIIKDELPKSWEEYINQTAWVRNAYAGTLSLLEHLLMLRDVYRNGWKPDWNNEYEDKFILYFYKNKLKTCTLNVSKELFSFQSKEIRDKFYENFKNELEQLKELY